RIQLDRQPLRERRGGDCSRDDARRHHRRTVRYLGRRFDREDSQRDGRRASENRSGGRRIKDGALMYGGPLSDGPRLVVQKKNGQQPAGRNRRLGLRGLTTWYEGCR